MYEGFSTTGIRRPTPGPGGGEVSMPIPFGWYALAIGADLEPGDVEPIYCFDRHLVAFRTEGGRACVTSAFCPHLGAHLGYGGRVDGETIVCPFHGWRFNGDGVCEAVPYARSIPRRAAQGPCLYSYPVEERNGMIWAWHHPRQVPPLFDLDDVPELADPEWSEPIRFEWEVNAPIQETGENAVDVAHFVAVHGAKEVPDAEITLAGHRRETELTALAPAIDDDGNIDFTRMEKIRLLTRGCGPGMSTQAFELGARTVMLGTTTPITADRMKLVFSFTKRLDTPARFKPIVDGLISEIVRQVEQDIPIWENKVFQEAPILCDGDGPIAKYRRWFGQFYDNPHASEQRPLASRASGRLGIGQAGQFFRQPARHRLPLALLRSGVRMSARIRPKMASALASAGDRFRELTAALGEIAALKNPCGWFLRPHPVESERRSNRLSDR